VVVEITERSLASRPAELLHAVERVRRRGWGIALDDVGADWRSVALLPFLRPDVVKLDRSVVADPGSRDAARVIRAVREHTDRHGGIILAEGIETAEQAQQAREYGARLGQGWHFGRPAAVERSAASRTHPGVRIHQPRAGATASTPFGALVRSHCPRGIASKAELLDHSMALEREAFEISDPCVILATFQSAERFTARVHRRYAELATGAALVAAFAVGLSPEPAPGVRGANLDDGEALRDEWCVVIVGPHTAKALIALDLGDRTPDMERRFEYAMTDDVTLVMAAARSLMHRVAAETGAPKPERPPAPARPAPRRDAPLSRAS
jgi:hypothetical protein